MAVLDDTALGARPPAIARSRVDAWVRQVEGRASLERADIEGIQLQKLNALLRRERERKGFYRNLPVRLDSLDQLRELPFTTADDLAGQASGLLLTSQARVAQVVSDATSATTGSAKRLFYSQADLDRTVSFFAGGLSELIAPGDAVAVCMPFSREGGLGELISAAVERLGAEAVRIGVGGTFREVSDAIRRSQAAAYVGFPVALLSLLRCCDEPLPLKRALVSADACGQKTMGFIGDLLGTWPVQHYGSRETVYGGAVTCPACCGMHVRENDIIAETVEGELVITTIGMDALPLIRYRTGDSAHLSKGRCTCGSSLARLDRVGRIGDAGVMGVLDEEVFALPSVVDYRVGRSPGRVLVEVLSKGSHEEALVRDMVARRFPGSCIDIQTIPFSPDAKPFYPAKRKVEGSPLR